VLVKSYFKIMWHKEKREKVSEMNLRQDLNEIYKEDGDKGEKASSNLCDSCDVTA